MKIFICCLMVCFFIGCCPKCDKKNVVSGIVEKVEFQKSGFGSSGLTIVYFKNRGVISFHGDTGFFFAIGKKNKITYDGFRFIKKVEVEE